MSTLSESLHVLMQENRLTVSMLAAKAELSPIVILRILTSKLRDPRLSTLQKIAAAFELTISEILGETLSTE